MAERIAVIGISGSGKTTFAKQLSAKLNLPLKHADTLEWLSGWRQRPPEELAVLHAQWLAEPRWVFEGWVDADRATRLAAADLVIDLDLSRSLCAWRAFRRMLKRDTRAEMPEGNRDHIDLRFLWVVLRGLERPHVDAALQAAMPKTYLRFTSPRMAEAWMTLQKQ